MKNVFARGTRGGLAPAVLCALTSAAAPAAAAPGTAEQVGEPGQPPDAPASLAHEGIETGVELQVQSGVVWRSFSFDQDIYDRLRTLHGSLVVYRFDAAVYPTFNWLPLQGHIGLIAGYEGTLTGSVHDSDFGKSFPIEHSELYGGLRLRRPVRRHALGFDVTVGRLHSGLDDGRNVAGVPDVSYTEVRSSLDFRMIFERLQATAAAGLRVPLAYGEVGSADWFPRLEGYALEAALRASYRLSARVALEAGTSLRRYVLEMNSEPEDASDGRAEVAGGAIDAYWGGYLGVSFAL
jgi:hypothetical protein